MKYFHLYFKIYFINFPSKNTVSAASFLDLFITNIGQTYLSHNEYMMPNSECNFTVSELSRGTETKRWDI